MEQMKRAGDGWGDNSQPEVIPDDQERRKTITVGDREWVLQARDPHGFWWVMIPGGGAPPAYLSGAYTGLWEAHRAVEEYMIQNPQSPAKAEAVRTGSKPPQLKLKKVPASKQVTADA